jgi:8-oxo-dGTP pyrophosphatase MutT (NUDIX family)
MIDAERRRILQDWLKRGPDAVCADDGPQWLSPLISALRSARPGQLSLNDPPAEEVSDRQAAVLILLGGHGVDDVDVVLTQRAPALRDHPGEIAFPGGGWEPADTSPVDTALREAYEEIGVDRADISPLLVLPRLFIPPSGFDVTGVLGYWRQRRLLAPTDTAETQRVFSVSLRELAEPQRWDTYSTAGWQGPSTRLDGDALLWGYTAEVLTFISNNIGSAK